MKRLLLALLCSALTFGCAENASSEYSPDADAQEKLTQNPLKIPPFLPGDNESVSSNEVLSKKCGTEALKTFPGIQVDYSLVTESEEWGFVWRADMTTDHDRKGRVVCWSPKEIKTERVILDSKFLDDADKPLP